MADPAPFTPAAPPPLSIPDTPVVLVPQRRDDQPRVPAEAPPSVAAELRRLRIAAGLTVSAATHPAEAGSTHSPN
ncbi:hypothetical protein HUO13_23795 [Saccharopolyspora erythraea]|uniref:hypothetical protein n=1 Tax=Saccharopolyspora erythraea TaxID=1836 RepID=UPI001BAC8250|nr:hypothetical protein [Saccharopolyspora erythraea]QUH03440.1 hypothetical protein HUO13_23795 [Saccharopolyspora erythraea]